MKNLQIKPEHLKIVTSILQENTKSKVFAFGSRTKGTARELSDLDLLIKDEITKVDLSKLREAFEESNLPFKVDLVVWADIEENFKKNIEKDLVEFTY